MNIWENIKFRAKISEISIIASTIKEFKFQIWTQLPTMIMKIIEWLLKFNFHFKFLIGWLLLVAIVTGIIYFFLWEWISDFYGLSNKPIQGKEPHSQIIRNLGWLLWMAISFLGLSIGLDLALWGRQIQHKSHLQERYEKAAAMLGNEVMPVRVAGCLALMSLGKEDKSMKEKCVSLLFSFINDPYLKPEQQGKNLDEIFPEDEPLRTDIQQAADSFSAIYNHYKNEGIYSNKIVFQLYFWKNKYKSPISLMKANLLFESVNLQKAYLYGANLRESFLYGTNLYRANLGFSNLYKIILEHANLQEANLEKANLQEANLSQAILSQAILVRANLQGANLSWANLQGAYLGGANLKGADLSQADLRGVKLYSSNFERVYWGEINFKGTHFYGVDITDAEINLAENLTKKQILSATWGIDRDGNGNPPLLPKKLIKDPAVKKWLANPHYNKKEEEEESRKAFEKRIKAKKTEK